MQKSALAVHRLLATVAALVSAGPGAIALAWLYQVFAGRAGFPLDLEWMEGGVLVHALRLQQGLGIYVPPSVDFIPFLYTPLYPALLAALGHLFPLGYTLGRMVSIVALSGTFLVSMALAVASTGDTARARSPRAVALPLAMAVGAVGAVAAGYTFSGTFFDLVRADSLMIWLMTGALALAYLGRSWRSAAVAGLVVAAAFFTKQTAALLAVALGLALLATQWRRGVSYGVAGAAAGALGLAYLQWRSGGWFWTYVFELHQSHAFNKVLAYRETPLRLLRFAWPLYMALALSVVGLALGRRLERRDGMPLLMAVAGFVAACVGFGTQWAFDNAFIPALVFPAVATAILAARLVTTAAGAARGSLSLGLSLLVAISLALACLKPDAPDKQALVPSRVDRRAAGRFLSELSRLKGEGFIPFHPFYSVLVNQKPFVHRMGVLDVAAQLGRPKGLDEAIASQRFDFIILDWKSRPYEWPALETRYHVVRELTDGVDAVRMFSGAQTSPRHVLFPIRPAPELPPGSRVRFDFEQGTWGEWRPEGAAFASTPAPAPHGAYGRFSADSRQSGLHAKGTLTSAPFTILGDRLQFWLDGEAQPDVRVSLNLGREPVLQASPTGAPHTVDWDVRKLAGQTVTLVLEDQSERGGLVVDHVVELGAP